MKAKHIALVIPHTDVMVETDLKEFLPKNYVIHTQRMWLDEVGEEAEKRMVDVALPDSIKYLKGIIEYDAAIFGCTSASAVYGEEGLNRIHSLLSKEFGCPAISAFGGILREVEKRKTKKLAMITPYSQEVNNFMIKSLNKFGIEVAYSNGLGFVADYDICHVKPEDILTFVKEHKEEIVDGVDLCFMSCTNFRTMEILEELKQILGIDVITSNFGIYNFIMENA